jgi:NACHT domain/TIR domain
MSTSALGPREHAEIRRFRAALTLDPGVAIHVIVADTRRVLDQALAEVGEAVVLVRPLALRSVDVHEHAAKILHEFEDALERAGGRPVVLDAIVSTPVTDRVWRRVFNQLNELRNFTEQRSSGALIFGVSPRLEAALGHEAPDVWSKRGSGMRLIDRTPNRIFVSYSGDSREHTELVQRVASELVEAGLSVFLDLWQEEPPPEGWPAFVELELRRADVVLCVCTPAYRARIDGEAPIGRGRGATWESRAIREQAHELGPRSDRLYIVELPGAALAIPIAFGTGRLTHRWPEDRARLIEALGAVTVHARLRRCLERAFGDDLAALESWAGNFLMVTTTTHASVESRARVIIDGLLRMKDSQAQAQALALLAAALGADDEWVAAIAGVLGLGDLPPLPSRRSSVSPSPSPVPEAELARYLAEVASRYRELSTEDLYVPLDAILTRRGARKVFASAEAARADRARDEIPLATAFARAGALGRRGIILLGDPGSGKSTHLKQLLLKVAREGAESIGLPKGTVPIFLPLRNVRRRVEDMWDFIAQELDAWAVGTAPRLGERLWERGGLLLLLDGLDEVADAEERVRVSRWIEQARRSAPGCYFVVSSRFAGYTRDVELGAAFLELHLRPFDDAQVRRFVIEWYSTVETATAVDAQQAALRAEQATLDLLEALASPAVTASARLYALTRNPLLLTMICQVHRALGRLPGRDGVLYEECVRLLLERSNAGSLSARSVRAVLEPIALWLHEDEGRTRATAAELEPVVGEALAHAGLGLEPQQWLRSIRDESGVLTGWGIDVYGFMHLGFQEYLAARELRSRAAREPEVLATLASRFGSSWWQEVILLLLAEDDPPLFEPFMREVVGRPEFVEWSRSEMMSSCSREAARTSSRPFMELLEAQGGRDLSAKQLAAVQLMDRLMPSALDAAGELLETHPTAAVRRWWMERARRDS